MRHLQFRQFVTMSFTDLNRTRRAVNIALLSLFIATAGALLQIGGTSWDITSHLMLKPETFFTPSHTVLYTGIGLLTISAGIGGVVLLENKKGIVVDLRCYPSDFIVFSMGNLLMPQPTAFVKFKNHNQKELDGFYMSDPLEVGIDFPDYYKGKIAILVNEETQSQAEYTAMAFQVAPKARVFGSQTAGADGNVSEIILPGGFKTYMTHICYAVLNTLINFQLANAISITNL